MKHLYRDGAKQRQRRRFQRKYGKTRGTYIYGAVVGKVKRERTRKSRRRKTSG
jgi:hypothetical protein